MEPSWHVLGPEPARFGPAPGLDRKAPAYERMQRFSSQIIRASHTAKVLRHVASR
jgi:hypothetical protein